MARAAKPRPGSGPTGHPAPGAGDDALAAALDAIAQGTRAVLAPAPLARALGLSPAALEEQCLRQRHDTLRAELRRVRLARARSALLASTQSTDSVATACGFAHAAALDRALLATTGVDAQGWRASRRARSLALALPPGYSVADALAHLGRDRHSLTQRVDDAGNVVVALRTARTAVRARLRITGGRVAVQLDGRGRWQEEDGPLLLEQIARLLGLGTPPEAFERRARRDPRIARLIAGRRGLRVTATACPFDAVVWSVIGQQISLPFAFQLLREATVLAGVPAPGGLFSMPAPEHLAALSPAALTARRFSAAKASYVVGLAEAASSGALALDALARGCARTARATLLDQRGLGPWSVAYVMMRGLRFADCAPVGDAGLRRALHRFDGLDSPPADTQVDTLLAPFSPHRSLASFHLWRSLARAAAP